MSRSLSPLSVPYRVLQRGGGIAVAVAFAMGGGVDLPGVGPAGPIVLFAIAGVGALALIGYETAYVRRFTYDLSEDTLDIESGVVSRRSREIPLRRIQNVDISRNVIQRPLGIAVVSFETAGGGDTEARLRFVSFEEAKRLQATLGRLKREDAADDGDRDSGVDAEPGGDAEDADPAAVRTDRSTESTERRYDAPPVTELFALGRTELAVVGALSIDFRVPGILFVIVSTVGSTVIPRFLSSASGVAFAVAAAAVVVGVALLSWVVGAAAAIAQYYDFRLVRSGDELQYERGLLQRYDGSIPFDKVQTLTVADNPLKRAFGYATLYIETAGYAPGSGGSSRGSEAAVPLAERDRVLELIEELEPVGDVEFRRPPKRARRRYLVRYLFVVGILTGLIYAADAFLTLPFPPWSPALLFPFAIWFAHATWRHRGHWLGDHHVVTRNGVFRRRTKVVPYYRIQTVIDARTVFQRRLGLATVTVDTAGSLSLGGQDAAAVDISEARADDLRDELEARLDRAVDAYRAGRAGIGVDDAYDADATEADADGADTDASVSTPTDRNGDDAVDRNSGDATDRTPDSATDRNDDDAVDRNSGDAADLAPDDAGDPTDPDGASDPTAPDDDPTDTDH